MKKILLFLLSNLVVFNLFSQGFDALSNPKILVDLTHPPGLGLKMDKVIFNPATGNCSDQIIDALISDFVSNNVEVLDRENLQLILAEQNFNLSGYVDKNNAISIGKIIGPSAMITTKVLTCEVETKNDLYRDVKKYNTKTKQSYTKRLFISKTTVNLKVSIQTTDLTSGRIFSSRIFEYTPSLKNESYDGIPEAPKEFDVQELAFKSLVKDVHKLFFSWTESTDLYFMNDKKGGLKEAFKALKAGNVEEAFQLSEKNLEFCKNSPDIKDKVLSHAFYNLGMMNFIINNHDKAILLFKEAKKIRPGNIISEAIAQCKRARDLLAEMQKIDDRVDADIQKANNDALKTENERIKNTLTNEDIISLTEKKLPTVLILQKIKTSECNFNTSADELIKLSNAGVSEEVLLLMMEK